MQPGSLRIGLVGYGEVGKILARALVERGAAWVGTYDRLLRDPSAAAPMRAHAEKAGVVALPSLEALLERVDVAISAVTASQTLAVATEAARAVVWDAARCLDDPLDGEIALHRPCRTDRHRLVRHLDVQRVLVRVRIDCDGRDPHRPRSTDHAFP